MLHMLFSFRGSLLTLILLFYINDKARSIWYSGGGAWVFGPGQNIFFRTKSEQDYFFRRPFGPDYFFFINESYIYNI